MSLNLNDRPPAAPSKYHMSPAFNDAVNDAQFVRTFGITALVCSVLAIIRPEIAIGVGIAVLGFGKTRYYRTLGLAVTIVSIAGVVLAPLRVLGCVVLALGIGWKGLDILNLLSREGKEDPDWQETRKRVFVGMTFSAIGLLVNVAWTTWFLIALWQAMH